MSLSYFHHGGYPPPPETPEPAGIVDHDAGWCVSKDTVAAIGIRPVNATVATCGKCEHYIPPAICDHYREAGVAPYTHPEQPACDSFTP